MLAGKAGATPDAARDISQLQFKVEAFSEAHLPLVAAFSERYWTRPRTEAFYAWRYLKSQPFSRLFLAVTDTECLGMVYGLRKSFLVNGVRTPCLEIFDWHSLPGLRGSGVGIRVMRAMMREGQRLIGVGGTADVLTALPAMGWQTLGAAVPFELPMSADFLGDAIRERVGLRVPGQRPLLNAVVGTWFYPRVRGRRGAAVPVGTLGSEVDALYEGLTGYDFLQVPDPAVLEWITASYPGTGSFAFWYFTIENRLRGWVLTRIYETDQGREAAIVEIFAPQPEQQVYTWMISEAAASLAGAAPRVIRARATCPVLQAAFRANRFRSGTPAPVFTWPKMPDPPSRLHITLNHTDAWLRPYPTAESAHAFLV